MGESGRANLIVPNISCVLVFSLFESDFIRRYLAIAIFQENDRKLKSKPIVFFARASTRQRERTRERLTYFGLDTWQQSKETCIFGFPPAFLSSA